VEKSVRRDGDWAFVFGVLRFEIVGGGEGWGGGIVGILWNVWESEGNGYGLWGRGSEKGRSWFWNYPLCLAKLGPNCGEM